MLLQFPYFFCFHYVVITVKYLYSCNLQDPEGNRIKGGKYQGKKYLTCCQPGLIFRCCGNSRRAFLSYCRVRVGPDKRSLIVNPITYDQCFSILVITSLTFSIFRNIKTLKKYYYLPSSLSLNKIISSRKLCCFRIIEFIWSEYVTELNIIFSFN